VVFSADSGISIPSGKRRVGMVFQSYALWPHMAVYDNVGFGLWLQKVPRKQAREHVDKVLQDLDMAGLGERYPSELSGGQQQRVAVARLLATKPPVFLMDEPLSNLDARLRLDMRSELKRLHYQLGVTTVYVTHDQTEAMTMATRVVVIAGGRIQQIDAPQQIYRKPANIFTAEFIGMPRINSFPAKIALRNGAYWLEMDDINIPLPWNPAQKEVTAAIRPEDITICTEPVENSPEFQIYAVLPSGPEIYVQIKRGNRIIMIRENRQLDLQMDQPVWLKIDPAAVNLYDSQSGLLIERGKSGSAEQPTKGGYK
jgi:ABC-type sugar transport system ATPase subunit